MAKLKYGMSATIPYGIDSFEVTGIEYCAWEDSLEKCNDGAGKEWATYDFLISLGHFVSKPKSARPSGETAAKPKAKAAVNPGIRDVFRPAQTFSGEAREPEWTQSKILTERGKLLTEREKIHGIKDEALQAKIREQAWIDQCRKQVNTIDLHFYKPNGEPYTIKDWAGVVIAITFIISMLIVMFK